MKPADLLAAIGTLLGAVSTAFAGNIAWMMAFLLIAFLFYRLLNCERKHNDVESRNRRLSVAVAMIAHDLGDKPRERIMKLLGEDEDFSYRAGDK